jgi:hypothetical protein
MDPNRSLRRLSPPRRQVRLEAREERDRAAPKPTPEILPRPALHPATAFPSREEFDAWCRDPVTRFVATAYAISAKLNEEAWRQVSWVQADPDPVKLVEFKARADAYEAFLTVGYARYAEIITINREGDPK